MTCSPESPVLPKEASAEFKEALANLYRDLDAELESLGAQCDACGRCCRFKEWGHQLWIFNVELMRLLSGKPLPNKFEKDVCPYQEGNKCMARKGRSLGCRLFFCKLDSAVVEDIGVRYIQYIQKLARDAKIPLLYGELMSSLTQIGDKP